jgi:hypothetical protein
VKAWQRRAFAAVSAIVIVSGVVYFWMKYWLVSDDPFAVVNHPLQPYALDVHVLVGPAFLVVFGVVLDAHVSWALRSPAPLRRSGLTSLVTIVAMIASGYLLQVITGEQLRRACAVAHIASGVAFAAAYVTHVAGSWRRYRQLARAEAASS